jgi:1-deoxy-D-xylulose-5-phosphate reductoisomerase
MKNIVLLGATGSIGQSTLNVLRQNSDSFNLLGIAFNNNFDIALDIANEFKPDFIFYSANVTTKDHPLFSFDAQILSRSENLREMIQHQKLMLLFLLFLVLLG